MENYKKLKIKLTGEKVLDTPVKQVKLYFDSPQQKMIDLNAKDTETYANLG